MTPVKKVLTLRVALNGTDTNPYHRMGLTQNPFPQLARAEWDLHCLNLQKLGGDPIPHDRAEEYIRQTLLGFSTELVDLCVAKFRPGEYVKFEVKFPVEC